MILNQRGFTLISLMVGTVVSMIGILALLFLYKNLVHTSVSALSSAKQDGQIASAQMTMQKELQTAGFGIVDAKASNNTPRALILLKDTTLTSNALPGAPVDIPVIPFSTITGDVEGNALIWSYRETTTGAVKCAGLLVQQDSSTAPYSLYRLQSTSNCSENLTSASITWRRTLLVTEGQTLPTANAANPWPFAARRTTCWPFGKGSDSSTLNYPQITIRTRASSVDGSGEPLVTSTTVCLPNFPES